MAPKNQTVSIIFVAFILQVRRVNQKTPFNEQASIIIKKFE